MSWIEMLGFPLSLILSGVCIAVIALIGASPRFKRLRGFFKSERFIIAAISIIIFLLAIEGTWSVKFQHNVFFLSVVLALMASTGICSVEAICQKRSISFILCHFGFFIILFGGFWGATDRIEAGVTLSEGEATNFATREDGSRFHLPWVIELDDFTVDYYSDLTSPKQYTSTLSIDGMKLKAAVNSPGRHDGWLVYQAGFDKDGSSTLKLVRDPWLPLVFLGMLISALGALLSLRTVWHSKYVLPTALILSAVFAALSLGKISLGTLVPALRSFWFIPHLAIYMLAYSLLAIAVILRIAGLCGRPRALTLSHNLLSTSSTLLLIGMLSGAVWAEYAWGDYWTWDAKECWAAVTWLLTIAGTHVRQNDKKAVTVLTVLAFLAMQVTWYGVNYLPSSSHSLHSYTAVQDK